MNAAYDSYHLYRLLRKQFAIKTYLLLLLWLILAVIQWALICLFDATRQAFGEYFYISFVTFVLAVLLFSVFIFWERLRLMKVLNFFYSFLIVELQTISLFTLVARAYWVDLMVFFAICFLLLWLFILIGSCLPRKMDLTLDVAIIFIMAFIFMLVAIYFLMISLGVSSMEMIAYIIFEIAATLIIMFFIMYHAQTILGSRFAEMRLNDAYLGSLILFHDFLIIYWLTFYWQILYRPFTPDYWVLFSTLQDFEKNITKSGKKDGMRLLDAEDDGFDEDGTGDTVVGNEADSDENEPHQSQDTGMLIQAQGEEDASYAEDNAHKNNKMLIFNAKRVHEDGGQIDNLDENSQVHAPQNEAEHIDSYDGGGLDGGSDVLGGEQKLDEIGKGDNAAVVNTGEENNVINVPVAREGMRMSANARDLPNISARIEARTDAEGSSLYVTMDGASNSVGDAAIKGVPDAEATEDVTDSFNVIENVRSIEESGAGAVEDSPGGGYNPKTEMASGAPDGTNLFGGGGDAINDVSLPLPRISVDGGHIASEVTDEDAAGYTRVDEVVDEGSNAGEGASGGADAEAGALMQKIVLL